MRNFFVLFMLLLVSLGNIVLSAPPSHTYLTPNGRVELAYQEPGQTKEENSQEKFLRTSYAGKASSTLTNGLVSVSAEGPVLNFGIKQGDNIGFNWDLSAFEVKGRGGPVSADLGLNLNTDVSAGKDGLGVKVLGFGGEIGTKSVGFSTPLGGARIEWPWYWFG